MVTIKKYQDIEEMPYAICLATYLHKYNDTLLSHSIYNKRFQQFKVSADGISENFKSGFKLTKAAFLNQNA